jgi:hypothetical protein
MGEGIVMSIETARDPRVTLMREKYFTMRPKPLERWVWQQGLPASAERVYWFHWDLGAQNGTWCSQVPLRVVARECCLDPATVTRAYQLLKRLGLLRREDPGRDPNNPFQQATAVTEVRVPRELVVSLAREPNRRSGRAPTPAKARGEACTDAAAVGNAPAAASASGIVSRDESRAVFAKLSAGERTRFAQSGSHRRSSLEFDADTRLTPTDRAHVLATLESLARARPAAAVAASPPGEGTRRDPLVAGRPRRLSALELLRVQKGLQTLAETRAQPLPGELLGEVVYALECGSLLKFPVALAVNIALKKIREGAWSSPYRMPPDWSMRRALPVPCSAAGRI